MRSEIHHFSRYLPLDQKAIEWGWQVVDAGYQTIPENAAYPPDGHPSNYLFDKKGRRSLDEFQIVLITKGRGHFASRSMHPQVVEAGQALVLFPNEWHRYSPDAATGWTEYWVGFRGREAQRLMAAAFDANQAVHTVGQMDSVLNLFDQLFYWLGQPVSGREQILAGHLPLLLALLQSQRLDGSGMQGRENQLTARAKKAMLAQVDHTTDFEALARQLGTSYSTFRAVFKKETGYAPRQYENIVRLNRAKDLLISTHLSVSQTAETLGFSSVYYFSRAFKRQFGQAPAIWRDQATDQSQRASATDRIQRASAT